MRTFLVCLSVLVLGSVLAHPAHGLLFEDRCATLDNWDVLDLSETPGEVHAATDLTCPPGYGPEVIRVRAGVLLLMPKGVEFSDGTIVALYRENDTREADADGVIMVWTDYPMDIAEAHNTKEKRAHLWVEQDNDCGFQYRMMREDGSEDALLERPGYGVVTDPWNKTNWIWQKVLVEGNRVRAKYWPVNESEPAEWAIDATYDGPRGKRLGIRVNSGDIHLAYFAADTQDIQAPPTPAMLHFPLPRAVQARRLPFTLFTNAAKESEESFEAVVTSGDAELARTTFDASIPAGSGELALLVTTDPKAEHDGPVIVMKKEPAPGLCTLELRAASGAYTAKRTFRIDPATDLYHSIAQTRAAAEALGEALAAADQESPKKRALCVLRDAARAHAERAASLVDEGKVEEAGLSLRFAAEALAELKGYKGAWLKEVAPNAVIPEAPYDPNDKRRVGQPKDGRIADFYSMDYLLSFDQPTLSAQSFCMGKSYEVTIPWRVEGATPDRDFKFNVRLASPLGNRVVAQSNQGPAVPTSQWQPGETYVQKVTLNLPPEDPSGENEFLAAPPILDEYHRVLVTATDPETGARVLLGNEPGPHPGRMGSDFLVKDVYISSSPVEISDFSPQASPVHVSRTDGFLLRNQSGETADLDVLFTATTETGRVVYQEARPISLGADGARLDFDWTLDTAGPITLTARILRDNVLLTQARRTREIAPPPGQGIKVTKANHVERDGGRFFTPITVRSAKGPFSVVIKAGDRVVGAAESAGAEARVEAEPWFGYYDILVQGDGFRYDRRLIATVVETSGTDLLVNGEPFIVKGVNVHGMDGGSPERTASMMRVMRDLGFNMWRGDYPARWQVDLAYELNTAYTVLAPFSCCGTEEIFGRQAGPPMTTARELTRLFIDTYKDSAGVLLWNSCNEVGGETIDFLLAQYPPYKAFDPHNRPVHYANLFGQDYHQGQDAMGVNSYFGKGLDAASRHPIVSRSLAIAREHDLPMFYCEFNSWHGAIQSSGADAFRNLFAWGVEQGMAGGFQYMKGNSDRHPGIFDNGYNTHKIHNDAIIDALADARVAVESKSATEVRLKIINKRHCTLRGITLSLAANGVSLKRRGLPDLPPKAERVVEMALPQGLPGPALTLEGTLEFTTHFGFQCNVPVNLLAR